METVQKYIGTTKKQPTGGVATPSYIRPSPNLAVAFNIQ